MTKPETSHHTLPPFPDDIDVAPLLSISLSKLEANDEAESKRFFEACKDLGFFYLDMFGSPLGEKIIAGAEGVNAVQQEWLKLSNAEKDKYGRPHLHDFFAYRFATVDGVFDKSGDPLRIENYNIRKDDVLGLTERLDCHQMILDSQDLLENYMRNCHAVIDLLLEHLDTNLGLPDGTLLDLHKLEAKSGDHVRFNRAPAQPFNEDVARRGEHTDYGSLTILFNWLGGLQIRRPDNDKWVYVRPVPGSPIVNLGDAMVAFTAGILRSNVHRVVPPPAPQDKLDRSSLVYFARPEDDIILRRLKGGLVDQQPQSTKPEPEMTAAEWWMKRGTGVLPGIYTKEGFEDKGVDFYAGQPAPIKPVAAVQATQTPIPA